MSKQSVASSEICHLNGSPWLSRGTPEDEQEVLDFLHDHFVPVEPINEAIGLCELGYRIPYFDAWVSGCLKKEDTVLRLARDDQGVLLGLVIVGIVNAKDKEEEEEEDGKDLPRWRKCPDKMHKIFTFLGHLKSGVDIAEDYGVSQWGDILILACNANRRLPGLGTALTKAALQDVEEQGVKVISTTATSHYSAKIFAKMGFKEVRSENYVDYRVDGEALFPPKEPHTQAKFFIKAATS